MPKAMNTKGESFKGPVIHQPDNGYRYSIDPFLLSSFVRLKDRGRVLDLGSGVGIIGILLALRYKEIEVVGVEIQESLYRFSLKNIEENGLSGRMSSILGDFREIRNYFLGASFDLVVSNPPYRKIGTGKVNPAHERALARHEITGGVMDVIGAAGEVLGQKGKIFLIYTAMRSAELISGIRDGGFEPKRMRFIHSRENEIARMVMVEAVYSAGVEVQVLEPLIIYDNKGEYTPEVAGIFNGFTNPEG